MGKPRLNPHRARVRAANGEAELAAGERLAQEQAIKAQSRSSSPANRPKPTSPTP